MDRRRAWRATHDKLQMLVTARSASVPSVRPRCRAPARGGHVIRNRQGPRRYADRKETLRAARDGDAAVLHVELPVHCSPARLVGIFALAGCRVGRARRCLVVRPRLNSPDDPHPRPAADVGDTHCVCCWMHAAAMAQDSPPSPVIHRSDWRATGRFLSMSPSATEGYSANRHRRCRRSRLVFLP